MIKWTITIAIVLFVFLGIAAVDAQVHATLPQFKSGTSVMIGVPVDLKILDQRVGAIYDVVESDDFHIVWKFTGSTGDWAFVFADGRIVVASTVDFELAAKDTMIKELNDAIDMLNVVNPGLVTIDARNNALEAATYYASEPEIYHRLRYDFKSNFDLTLVVPDCTVKDARLTVLGGDLEAGLYAPNPGQTYAIDGKTVATCDASCTIDHRVPCSVSPVYITDKILTGLHKITASLIDNEHTMNLELITSPLPPKNFVLFGPNYDPWINETTKSMDLQELQNILSGKVAPTNNYSETIPGDTLPGKIIGIDQTSFPKVRVNVFVNTTCAKSGGLTKDNFKVMEEGNEAAINGLYFTGNASGQKLDLAIAFDDTGSMGKEISALKSKVEDLTDQIKTTGMDARYSLISFKDCYTIKANWSSDLAAFKSSVDSLQEFGGDDEPEVSMDAIESVLSMEFRPDAQKVIIVITDAHAHQIGDGTTYSLYTKDEVVENLKARGVIFIPVSPTFGEPSEFVDLRDMANEMQSMWIDINSEDFATILEQFKGVIIGTYVLEYTSPDLTPGTSRNVTVVVNNPSCDGAVGSANVTYISPMET
jgi:hypothetical protein